MESLLAGKCCFHIIKSEARVGVLFTPFTVSSCTCMYCKYKLIIAFYAENTKPLKAIVSLGFVF